MPIKGKGLPAHLIQNRLTLFVGTVLILCLVSGRGWTASDTIDPQIEAMLGQIVDGEPLPPGIKFKQSVTFRAFLFRWDFYSILRQNDEGKLTSTVHGRAPSFMPDTLPKELVNLGRSLSIFNLELLAFDPNKNELLVAGPRRDYAGSGAKEGKFWINTELGVVSKAEVAYNWGTLYVEQKYTTLGERLFLSKQSARVRPYGATLEVTYSDYSFP